MIYLIKNDSGEVVNRITATEEFMEANYKGKYELDVLKDFENETEQKQIEARSWRNEELNKSDQLITITDHPDRDKYLAYRTKLRDWPSTSDFPDTKPTL